MTEADLLAQVKWLLTLLEKRLPAFTWTRIHVMPVLRGRRPCRCGSWHAVLSKNTDMVGHSDLWVVYAGRIGFIELKATRGRLEESQEAFRDRVTRAQAKYHQAKTLKSVADFLCSQLEVPIGSVVKVHGEPEHSSGHRQRSDSSGGLRVREGAGSTPVQQRLDIGTDGVGDEEVHRDDGEGRGEHRGQHQDDDRTVLPDEADEPPHG